MEYDYLFKCLLIGDSGTGKSAILLRFTDRTYTDSYISTIGVDFKIQTLQVDEKLVRLQIWDTAGQERFRTITSAYYRGAHAVFIVFDLSERDSFRSVSSWLKEIRQHASESVKVVLVGNKSDLVRQRQVSTEEGEEKAQQYGFPYVETSARNATNIEHLFVSTAVELVRQRRLTQDPYPPTKTIELKAEEISNPSTCAC